MVYSWHRMFPIGILEEVVVVDVVVEGVLDDVVVSDGDSFRIAVDALMDYLCLTCYCLW